MTHFSFIPPIKINGEASENVTIKTSEKPEPIDIELTVDQNGVKVDMELLVAACLLHDVERLKEDHATAGADFLKELGYAEVAEVVEKHGLGNFPRVKPKTIE